MSWHYGLSLLWATFAAVFLFRKSRLSRNPRRLPLPPGPKGWPIIGNLFDVPAIKPQWVTYEEWRKKYGDMIFYNVMGQSVLVLASPERCNDLLEKRSALYSGRPQTTMLMETLACEWAMSRQNYGPTWRRHRRAVHEHLRPAALEEYRPIFDREVRRLLRRLLDVPYDFKDHVKLSFASGILKILYDLQVDALHHPHVERGETVMRELTEATEPGTYLVDSIPILKYIPSWMPGAGFKRTIARLAREQQDLVRIPFEEMLIQLNSEAGSDCVAAKLYKSLPREDDPHYQQQLDTAKNAAAITFLGGADTTVSSTLTFILAMTLHPEVVQKAHEEIDRVVGNDRLPDIGDKNSLIYISAIVKETLRWQVVAPIGIPHLLMDDDEYNGFFIPKGTIVLGAVWSILHDAEVYEDPLVFKPERFIKDGQLDPGMRDPAIAAFGFGRRICPGQHLAMESLWLTVAGLLAVYDILPPLQGKPLVCRMTNSSVSHPEDFDCRIVPRSTCAADLIATLEWDVEE